MRYKIYHKGTECKAFSKNTLCLMEMIKVKPSKHREEIEEYLENMSDPSLSVSGGVATLTFDPIPQQMAT